jgi:hypothetical protein
MMSAMTATAQLSAKLMMQDEMRTPQILATVANLFCAGNN